MDPKHHILNLVALALKGANNSFVSFMTKMKESGTQLGVSLLLATLLLSWIPTTAQAAVSKVDFEITNYHIDAYVESDGSMSVQEVLIYDGSFNGQFWNLEYATGGEKPSTTAALTDLEGNAGIYNAHDIHDIKVYSLLDPDGTVDADNLLEYAFIWSGTGDPGDTGVFEQSIDDTSVSLKIFSLTNESKKAFLITYRLENVAVLHQDVAEVYWNFVGSRWEETLHDVEINIHLPKTSEELRVFAHGPLYGASEIVDRQQVRLSIEKMHPGEMLDGRVVFSKDVLDSSVKTTSMDALTEILRIEQLKADKANDMRRNFLMLQYLITALSLLGLVSMIVGVFRIYLKYVKEKKTIFRGKYYRELPADYGPAVMSYNYHQKMISPKDLTASILDMIREKIFRLDIKKVEKKRILQSSKLEEEYTITDISKNLKRPLTRYEEFIRHWLIDKIGNGESTTFDEIENYSKDQVNGSEFYRDYGLWMVMVREEAESYGFFDASANKGITSGIFLGLAGIGLGVLAMMNGIVVGIANIPIGIGVMIYSALIKQRTKQGQEDYVKWKAFSKFLKDFSKLDDAVVPSIILWEHYLVYAVSLGIADKVIETMQVVLKPSDFNDPGLTFLRRSYTQGGLIAVHALNTSFTNVTRNAWQTASTRSSSGAGGGGGFSGGGGGGGGGGTGGGGF
jgi:uncharacterized membrane protein